eukprot:gene206-1781_t
MDAGSWAWDGVGCNAVEALCSERYDVWALDWSASIALHRGDPSRMVEMAEGAVWDFDKVANDKNGDIVRGVKYVSKRTNRRVHIVALCAGSIAVTASILNGGCDGKVSSLCTMSCLTHLSFGTTQAKAMGAVVTAVGGFIPEDAMVDPVAGCTSSWASRVANRVVAWGAGGYNADARIKAVYGGSLGSEDTTWPPQCTSDAASFLLRSGCERVSRHVVHGYGRVSRHVVHGYGRVSRRVVHGHGHVSRHVVHGYGRVSRHVVHGYGRVSRHVVHGYGRVSRHV